MTDYPFNPVLDKCEAGHHYYKRSDRMESSCPYCLKRGLELARAENEKLRDWQRRALEVLEVGLCHYDSKGLYDESKKLIAEAEEQPDEAETKQQRD